MDAKKLGQFIAEIRKEKEMTQSELASKLHVTDKAVSKWERGLGLPDINSIEPLANALGISVAEVMQAERISSLRIKKQGEVKNFCRSHPAGPRRIGLAQSSGKSTLPTKE